MLNELIIIALAEYGETGISGPTSNRKILKYFSEIGAKWVKNDDTAWCSAFVNWVLKQANLPYSSALNARSFLNYGRKTNEAKIGDIVVLWRISKDSIFGHVGFFIKETADLVFILGGNQNNMVNISAFKKDKVLDYRTI